MRAMVRVHGLDLLRDAAQPGIAVITYRCGGLGAEAMKSTIIALSTLFMFFPISKPNAQNLQPVPPPIAAPVTPPPAPAAPAAAPAVTAPPLAAAPYASASQRCVEHRTTEQAAQEVLIELKSSARPIGPNLNLVTASRFMPAGASFKVAINEPYDSSHRYFGYVEPLAGQNDLKYV